MRGKRGYTYSGSSVGLENLHVERPTGAGNRAARAPRPREVRARGNRALRRGRAAEGRDSGFFWQALALGTVLPRWGRQRARRPGSSPAPHKPSARARPLRNTPGKLRYGLFLSLPDIIGTLPYSLLTAGKTYAQIFFFFKYIHIYIRVCAYVYAYMYIYTHTPWLSNSSLSCTTNSYV